MAMVLFEYDEDAKRWQAYVSGVKSDVEARQAFSAVVITCQLLDPNLLHRTQAKEEGDGEYAITPAVRA